MASIPKGALLQKAANGVSYVYFPSYFYDKNATTHNKEKQKRLYIGKVKDDVFIPNRKFLANPGLGRKDAERLTPDPVDLSKVRSQSIGAVALLDGLAEKTGLKKDLETVYGDDIARQLLSLALFMAIDSESALSLYPLWRRQFWTPSDASLSSQYTSRLLAMIGRDEAQLTEFFALRAKRIRAKEFLSYDSTKIISQAGDIHDVRWAPSKEGAFQREVTLAVLCGQKSRMPVMFRVLPGNVPDVKTLRDLLCRWDEIGITKDAVAVMDRGYDSVDNIASLCESSLPFVIGQKTTPTFVRNCIEDNLQDFWSSRCYIGEHDLYAVTTKTTIQSSTGAKHDVWVHMYRSDKNTSLAAKALEKKLVQRERDWQNGKPFGKAAEDSLFKKPKGTPGDGSRLERDFDAIDETLRYKGFFAFVSNSIRSPRAALEIYRGRDCVEKVFSSLQSGMDLSSAGVHHEDTLRGKLLVCLLGLTMVSALSYSMEKEAVVGGQTFPRLYQDFTLKELLGELMNIRIISAPGQKSRISEITGRQKEIFARVGVPLPVEEVYAV